MHFNGCDVARMNMYVCVCISAALSKGTESGLEWTGATHVCLNQIRVSSARDLLLFVRDDANTHFISSASSSHPLTRQQQRAVLTSGRKAYLLKING